MIFVIRYVAQFPLMNEFLSYYVTPGSGGANTVGLIDLGLGKDPLPVTEVLGNAIGRRGWPCWRGAYPAR